ncbi:MAG: hypothetical protein H0V17_32410 [Deltaproteobacteria bacterium]|nr:hypothetical protein [Deltaproteobacteria bacterium]
MKRRLAITLALIGAMVSPVLADEIDPPVAPPVDPSHDARVLSDQGRVFHDLGLYDQAIVSYKAAYELAPVPGLLFNLAQAYRLAGDCANAALMYRDYLQLDSDLNRALARTHLATAERCLSERAIIRPTAVASLESAELGVAATATTKPRSGVALERAGTVVAIGGGALLGVGVYFAFRAASTSAEIEQRYAEGATFREVEDIDARGRRSSTLARGFVLGGGVAAVTGGVLYLLGRRQAKHAERTITIAPNPGGGRVGLTWAF